MKHIVIFALFCIMFTCITACTIYPTDDVKNASTSSEAAVYFNDNIMETLNHAAQDLGVNIGFDQDIFSDGYICNNFEDFTVYRTYAFVRMHSNVNVILLYFKDDNRFERMDLGVYSSLNINSISQTKDRDILCVNFTDGIASTGSEWIFKSFVTSLDYSISQKKIIAVYDYVTEGVYGYSGLITSKQQFAQCRTLDDKTAVFTFEAIPDESIAMPVNGPEIVIPQIFSDGEAAVFLFRKTLCNLPQEFVQQMNTLEGIERVEFEFLDAPSFIGTKLIIIPKNGYTVSCKFNESNTDLSFEDFRVFCEMKD